MAYITLTLVFIAIYWLYTYLRKKNDFFKELNVPYVPPVILFGNLAGPSLGRRHFIEVIKEAYNYLPDAKYIGLFNFTKPTVLLKDPEIIKNVTIKNFENFPDHPNSVDDSLDPLFAGNLFSIAGDRWKEARNLLTPAFTSSKMKAMFDLMVNVAKNVSNYAAEQARNPNNIIDSKDFFTRYTNDVIATCAFGLDIDSLKNPKNEFYVLSRQSTNIDSLLSFKLFMARTYPKLLKILRLKIVSDRVSKFFINIVRDAVETRDKFGISRPDMLQLMMDARGKTSENLKLDLMDMTSQVYVFLLGGFETSATQMCIISHELILNPEIQKRLQDEIDEVLEKTNGKPTYEAINAMPYLDAVFNESMRKHPLGHFLDRLCTKAFQLPPALPGYKPLKIEPGTTVWIPTFAIHHDPQYYENPEKFDPDRYLNKKVTVNQVENLGFGIGPRSCIGNRFAILETKILLFYLLARFTLKANEKSSKDFTYDKKSISLVPENGFWMTLVARK